MSAERVASVLAEIERRIPIAEQQLRDREWLADGLTPGQNSFWEQTWTFLLAALLQHKAVLERHRPANQQGELAWENCTECPNVETYGCDGHLTTVCDYCVGFDGGDGMYAVEVPWPCIEAKEVLDCYLDVP